MNTKELLYRLRANLRELHHRKEEANANLLRGNGYANYAQGVLYAVEFEIGWLSALIDDLERTGARDEN